MDLVAVERALAASEARPILVDARLLRRVIKRHRHLPGVGLQVPHARCYAIRREAVLAIAGQDELGVAAAGLPERVILLPRPEPGDRRPLPEILEELWRYAFHARVHQEINRLSEAGTLTPAHVRERIHRIGQTEFDEIRLVLTQDRMLLPPRDDLETYAEFAALYLELQSFAPALLREIFPTLADPEAADQALAEDLDVPRLLEASRPEAATRRHLETPPAHTGEDGDEGEALSPGESAGDRAGAGVLLALADTARSKGNLVRSALLRVRAGARDGARDDAEALARRLARALQPAEAPAEAPGIDVAAWSALLLGLAEHAVARGGLFRRVEARLLYDVQSACLAGEEAIGKVDLLSWALSLGRRPLTRLLPATRRIRFARKLEAAARKVARVGLPAAERARLGELCADARRRGDEALRDELRPAVQGALSAVGFRPRSVPERVALAKIVEELLDQATAHGHLGLGQLRDAFSRNQLKMGDLSGVGELLGADPLLAADRRLADAIDGVHRRGEVYLRVLQKVSSLLFGTGAGRWLTFYVILPIGGGYMLPFATGLVITEVAHLLGIWHHHHELDLVPKPQHLATASLHDLWLFPVTAVLLFGLLHSASVRAAGLQLARAVGFVLATVFVHAPRWIASRPLVQRLLRSSAVLALGRFVVKPGAVAAAVLYATPLHHRPVNVEISVTAAVFVAAGVALNSRAGILVEEILLDDVARTVRSVEQHVLPGLLRLVIGLFRQLTDAIDRGLYTVDEWLRFRDGQRSPALAVKAVLGLAWFAVAYVIRVYVNLLLEPTFNPLKHFPTVTVAAKIMLPVDKELIHAIFTMLRPSVGAVLGGTLAWLAAGSLPGFFGFLVWELKENYKLYQATRSATLQPVAIGHHGETMGALLKPGLHSGTLPKLWAKLRRAASKGDGSVEKHRVALREIEEAVERFVDRSFSALLAESERWEGGVHVAEVALASNRVRVTLHRTGAGDHGAGACAIAFEEQSGWLVAGVTRAGWAGALEGDERVLFENALGGLYHLADVDLVREQIAAALPPTSRYDIAEEGLLVWPAGWATELVYDLASGPSLQVTVRGEPTTETPSAIDRAAIVFREQGIPWAAWVAAWSGAPARVVKGTSLLPSR